MKLRALVNAEEAVSPVIGVVLIVAITVILAATVGTMALSMGETQDTVPQSDFEFDWDGGVLEITLSSGQAIREGRLYALREGHGRTAWAGTATGTVDGDTAVTSGNSWSWGTVIDSDTVRLVYDDGERSATLAEWNGPQVT